jgi:two-component system, LytTR family, response regulator
MRILTCIILDDELGPLERMAVLLGKMNGIKIIGMEENPEAAIESIAGKKPDLVFIDVEMPGMNGFEVVKEIRDRSLNPEFIFVTGYNQYAIKAIKSGAFDFLVKPVDIDELKETISRFRCRNRSGRIQGPIKPENLPSFTQRELEIIKLIAECKSSPDIASTLNISKFTVDTHRRNILQKTGLRKTTELVVFARDNGLV